MTKSWEQGEDEITRAAKQESARTGQDIAAIMRRMLAEAKVEKRQETNPKSHSCPEVSRKPKRAEAEEQVMRWYAAHIVMVIRLQNGHQTRFPVWENIVLISANSLDEAFVKAEAHGQSDESQEDEAFTWGGKPARLVFKGVRKLTECVSPEERPDDGTEVTFNELELNSAKAVAAFAAGRPTDVRYQDQFAEPKPAKAAKRPKRKP